MFNPVPNFPSFSDYDVIEDNDLWTTFRKLATFDLDALKDYRNELYMKRYHSWVPTCADAGVTPEATLTAVDSASKVDTAARWYFGLLTT